MYIGSIRTLTDWKHWIHIDFLLLRLAPRLFPDTTFLSLSRMHMYLSVAWATSDSVVGNVD